MGDLIDFVPWVIVFLCVLESMNKTDFLTWLIRESFC